MGKKSQRKGRSGELSDHKELRELGLAVIDKRALEAAGVETGADYEIPALKLSVQKKTLGNGSPLMMSEGRTAWKELTHIAQLRGNAPVMHWYEGQGPGKKPLDLAVIEWGTLLWLLDGYGMATGEK